MPFDPLSLPGVFAWLPGGQFFQDVGGVTPAIAAAAPVRRWSNSGGPDHPIWASTGISVALESGVPVLSFANASSYLSVALTSTFSATTFSVFGLVRALPNSSGFAALASFSTSGFTSLIVASQWNATGNFLVGQPSLNTNGTDLLSDCRWHVVGIVRNGTALTFYVDGAPAFSVILASNPSIPFASLIIGALLNTSPVAGSQHQRIREALCSNAAFSASQVADYSAYLKEVNPQLLPSPVLQAVFVGDSLTNGAGYVTPIGSYPYLCGSTSAILDWYNSGYGGYTAVQLSAIVSSWIAPQLRRCPSIVALWAGSNDLATTSNTAAQVFAAIASLAAALRSAGAVKIIVLGIMVRNAGGTFEARRVELNALLAAGYSAFAEVYLPISDSRLQNFSDTTYFADGVHLKQVGNQIIADMVRPHLTYTPPALTGSAPVRVLTGNASIQVGIASNLLPGWDLIRLRGSARVSVPSQSWEILDQFGDPLTIRGTGGQGAIFIYSITIRLETALIGTTNGELLKVSDALLGTAYAVLPAVSSLQIAPSVAYFPALGQAPLSNAVTFTSNATFSLFLTSASNTAPAGTLAASAGRWVRIPVEILALRRSPGVDLSSVLLAPMQQSEDAGIPGLIKIS
jgi:lysophospholipase L1-like esterase